MTSPLLLAALAGCSSDHQLHNITQENKAPEPIYWTDEMTQKEPADVDVLFVIDDSCSMSTNQSLLAANLPNFYDYLEDVQVDYHIGVTTTDMNDPDKRGQLQPAYDFRYLDANTQDVIDTNGLTDSGGNPLTTESVFQKMTTVGTWGSGSEMGIDAAYYSLTQYQNPDEANDGFWRDDASAQIILVSDEKDSSTEQTPDTLSDLILDQQADKDVRFHSIVGLEGDSCASYGEGYLTVSDYVGGLKQSICSYNWDDMLDELGMEAIGMSREVYLTYTPRPNTFEAKITCPDSGEERSLEVGDEEYHELEYIYPKTVRYRYNYDIPGPGCTTEVKYELQHYSEYYEDQQ